MENKLIERINEYWPEFFSEVIYEESMKNERYMALSKESNKIKDRFDNVADLMEYDKPKELSKEEIEALIELLRIESEKANIEMEAIYIQGHKDCFAYLKEIGLI